MTFPATPEVIDAILPQTQCGLCGYGGCMPYAKALLHENAAINLCPPGGVKGLRAIAELMQVDPEPYVAEMTAQEKPRLLAVIREAECIGCAKCISACPVDAILGSAKQMHTVIGDECTGCQLCVEPCPVDCIDMVVTTEISPDEEKAKAAMARNRFQAREERLLKENDPTMKVRDNKISSDDEKKAYILEAVQRAKLKKLNSFNQTKVTASSNPLD